MICIWCQSHMKPHPRGSEKRFCGDACRRDFHQAVRTWGLIGFDAGLIPVSALKRLLASRTRRPDTNLADQVDEALAKTPLLGMD